MVEQGRGGGGRFQIQSFSGPSADAGYCSTAAVLLQWTLQFTVDKYVP